MNGPWWVWIAAAVVTTNVEISNEADRHDRQELRHADDAAATRHQLAPAETHHKRMQAFWTIGHGFEGTASDWTEYVVWLLGVIGVFVYMTNHARRLAVVELDQLVADETQQADDNDDQRQTDADAQAADRAKVE